MSDIIAAGPIVIADGHHRLETALAYQRECTAEDRGANGILAFVVELAPEELEIRAIHRLVDAPPTVDLLEVLRPFFDLEPAPSAPATMDALLPTANALVVITARGAWLATPRPGAFAPSVELDTERLVLAFQSNPEITMRFHHDPQTVTDAVRNGTASGGILVRPVRIDQIRNVAQTRTRMPPKATFFYPKPRTGVLFRPLDPPETH